jgi:flavin reductase (DIM6/NTAB) family NADH-FMN oxidoreductase RutF
MDDNPATAVLSRAVYGCYLLTAAQGETINGMPLSLFVQVGFKPPLAACGVAPRRRTHDLIQKAGAFAVIFLRRDQKALVDRFKLKGDRPEKKFEGLAWKRGITGSPLLADCLGYIECRLKDTLAPGDHTLFIGEVINSELVTPGPLLTIQDLGKIYTG